MKLSKYVYKSGDTLVNLTTRVGLPVNASVEELRSNFFLDGQESEALDFALFGKIEKNPPRQLAIKCTPTWQCNLRCTHCFVFDKLTKKQEGEIDADKLAIFARNFAEHFKNSVSRLYCCFVGGEISIQVEKCLEITDKLYAVCQELNLEERFSVTTNGTILNLPVIDLFTRCDAFTISLDGVQELHNAQRIPVALDIRGKDMYRLVMENIKKLILMGFRDKLSVQGALWDTSDTDMLKKYFHDLVKVGVKPDQIRVGAVAPTRRKPNATDAFKEYLATYVNVLPCCNWRFGSEFAVDTRNVVYTDWYQASTDTSLGSLTDPIATILENHKKFIKREMTVLQDDKCLSCPVIGGCWGRCCYLSRADTKPSELCDQQALIQVVQKKAAAGELVNIID